MLRFGFPPYLECSSKGDRRFSAFYARVKRYENLSIEEVYQAAKVFEDGTTGLSWKQAKGRPCINQEQVRTLYRDLWCAYMFENPHLMDILVNASGVSDIFGQEGRACQAEELWLIRQREISRRK